MNLDTIIFNDTIESETRPVLIKFWAVWCGPCKRYAPIFDKFAEEHTEVACHSVDCGESEDLAKEYNIVSIPATLLFKDGELIQTKQGVLSEEQLLELIRKE
jgi:thioredoxin 1